MSGGSKTQEVLERTRGDGAVGDVTSCRNSRDVGSECSSSGPPQDVFVRGQSLDEPEGGYPEETTQEFDQEFERGQSVDNDWKHV